MKLLALLGSPHGPQGNTGRLLNQVLEGAEEDGARTETVVLKGDTVHPCMGCDVCHVKGKCVQKDGFEELKEKVFSADGIVLASPNYIFNISAQLKAFFDRCCGVVHCMSFWGKYGVSVMTSGGGEDGPVLDYMSRFLVTTGAVPVGAVSATMAEMQGPEFTDFVTGNARKLGRSLVQSWKDGVISPEVEQKRIEFQARMRQLVGFRGEQWKYEAQYWKEHYAQ